jgi:hypothetical protein
LLIGFFRALPTDLAWRRRFSAIQESSASFFDECAALTRTVHSWLKALHRTEARRTELQNAAQRATVAVTAPKTTPASFALPLFGVYNGTSGGYIWNEKDAIE